MGRPFWKQEEPGHRQQLKQRASVGALGKHITRRSRGSCELCGSRAKPRTFELAPLTTEPSPDRTLMACDHCRTWLHSGRPDHRPAHFLAVAVWHEEPAVRLAAARMLLSKRPCCQPWAMDALEYVDVDPDTGEFIDEAA